MARKPWADIEKQVRGQGWNDQEVQALKRRYYKEQIQPDLSNQKFNDAEQKEVAKRFFALPKYTPDPTPSVEVQAPQQDFESTAQKFEATRKSTLDKANRLINQGERDLKATPPPAMKLGPTPDIPKSYDTIKQALENRRPEQPKRTDVSTPSSGSPYPSFGLQAASALSTLANSKTLRTFRQEPWMAKTAAHMALSGLRKPQPEPYGPPRPEVQGPPQAPMNGVEDAAISAVSGPANSITAHALRAAVDVSRRRQETRDPDFNPVVDRLERAFNPIHNAVSTAYDLFGHRRAEKGFDVADKAVETIAGYEPKYPTGHIAKFLTQGALEAPLYGGPIKGASVLTKGAELGTKLFMEGASAGLPGALRGGLEGYNKHQDPVASAAQQGAQEAEFGIGLGGAGLAALGAGKAAVRNPYVRQGIMQTALAGSVALHNPRPTLRTVMQATEHGPKDLAPDVRAYEDGDAWALNDRAAAHSKKQLAQAADKPWNDPSKKQAYDEAEDVKYQRAKLYEQKWFTELDPKRRNAIAKLVQRMDHINKQMEGVWLKADDEGRTYDQLTPEERQQLDTLNDGLHAVHDQLGRLGYKEPEMLQLQELPHNKEAYIGVETGEKVPVQDNPFYAGAIERQRNPVKPAPQPQGNGLMQHGGHIIKTVGEDGKPLSQHNNIEPTQVPPVPSQGGHMTTHGAQRNYHNSPDALAGTGTTLHTTSQPTVNQVVPKAPEPPFITKMRDELAAAERAAQNPDLDHYTREGWKKYAYVLRNQLERAVDEHNAQGSKVPDVGGNPTVEKTVPKAILSMGDDPVGDAEKQVLDANAQAHGNKGGTAERVVPQAETSLGPDPTGDAEKQVLDAKRQGDRIDVNTESGVRFPKDNTPPDDWVKGIREIYKEHGMDGLRFNLNHLREQFNDTDNPIYEPYIRYLEHLVGERPHINTSELEDVASEIERLKKLKESGNWTADDQQALDLHQALHDDLLFDPEGELGDAVRRNGGKDAGIGKADNTQPPKNDLPEALDKARPDTTQPPADVSPPTNEMDVTKPDQGPPHNPNYPDHIQRKQEAIMALSYEQQQIDKTWRELQAQGALTPERMKGLQERKRQLQQEKERLSKEVQDWRRDNGEGGMAFGKKSPYDIDPHKQPIPEAGQVASDLKTMGPNTQLENSHWINKFDISDPRRKEILMELAMSQAMEGKTHHPLTGEPLESIPFRQMQQESLEQDPVFLNQLKKHGLERNETLTPPQRLALENYTKRMVRQLSERMDKRDALAASKFTDPQVVERENAIIDRLEKDIKGTIDILWKAKSQDGRNLAYHRILVQDAGFNPTFWAERIQREAGGVLDQRVLRKVQEITDRGQKMEDVQRALKEKLDKLPPESPNMGSGGPKRHKYNPDDLQWQIVARSMKKEISDLQNSERLLSKAEHEVSHEEIRQQMSENDYNIKQLKIALAITASRAARSGIGEVVSSARKASMLSAPTTAGRNIIGNLGMAAMEEGSKFGASAADWLMSKATGQRTISGPNLASVGRSLNNDGLSKAKEIMKYGATRDQMAKLDLQRELNSGSRILDTAVNTTFRFQSAQDQVFKSYAIKRSLEDQARVRVMNELRANPSLNKAERLKFWMDPKNHTEEMQANALFEAEIQTFTNSKGIAPAMVRPFKGNENPVVRFVADQIMPFAKTPANITARILDYGAIGGLGKALVSERSRTAVSHAMQGEWANARRAILARVTPEEQRAIAVAIGRGSVGLPIIYLGMKGYEAGMVTGPSNGDRGISNANRVQGKGPVNALAFGRWHAVGALNPVGNLLAVGAQMARDGVNPQKYLAAMTKTTLDQPMLSGLNDVVNAAQDPENVVDRAAGRYLGSYVPNVLAGVAKVTDPSHSERYATNALERVQARVPIWRNSLPTQHDAWGKPEERNPWNMVNPFLSQKANDSPAAEAVSQYGLKVTMPERRHVSIGKNKDADIPPDLYQEMLARFGPRIPDKLAKKANSPNWQHKTPEERQRALDDIEKETWDRGRRWVEQMVRQKGGR